MEVLCIAMGMQNSKNNLENVLEVSCKVNHTFSI